MIEVGERHLSILKGLRYGVTERDVLAKVVYSGPEIKNKLADVRRQKAKVNKERFKALMLQHRGLCLASISKMTKDDVASVQAAVLGSAQDIEQAMSWVWTQNAVSLLRQFANGLNAVVGTEMFRRMSLPQQQEYMAKRVEAGFNEIYKRQRQKTREIQMHDALRKEILQLEKRSLVKVYRVGGARSGKVWYQLTKSGWQTLVSMDHSHETAIMQQSPRCGIVPMHQLVHEAMVTEVIRALCEKGVRQGYRVTWIMSEATLRSLYSRRGRRRFPDVQAEVMIVGGRGGKRVYNIEVDNATQPVHVLVEKMDVKSPLLILCANNENANRRMDQLESIGATRHQNAFLISSVPQFVSSGLYSTPFLSPAASELITLQRPIKSVA